MVCDYKKDGCMVLGFVNVFVGFFFFLIFGYLRSQLVLFQAEFSLFVRF